LASEPDTLTLHGAEASGIETLAEVAVDLALVHVLEHLQQVVALVELGQPVIRPVVLRSGSVAIPGLHGADEELVVVLPVAQLTGPQRLEGTLLDIGLVVLLRIAGQRHVARQQVGQQSQIGQALDIGVAA